MLAQIMNLVKSGTSKKNIIFFHKISMNVSVVVFIFLKSANIAKMYFKSKVT